MEYVLHYDTSSSIGIIILTRMCARGAGHCDVLRIFQAPTQLRTYAIRMPEKLATRMMH